MADHPTKPVQRTGEPSKTYSDGSLVTYYVDTGQDAVGLRRVARWRDRVVEVGRGGKEMSDVKAMGLGSLVQQAIHSNVIPDKDRADAVAEIDQREKLWNITNKLLLEFIRSGGMGEDAKRILEGVLR